MGSFMSQDLVIPPRAPLLAVVDAFCLNCDSFVGLAVMDRDALHVTRKGWCFICRRWRVVPVSEVEA
jgi:hypothetical protein